MLTKDLNFIKYNFGNTLHNKYREQNILKTYNNKNNACERANITLGQQVCYHCSILNRQTRPDQSCVIITNPSVQASLGGVWKGLGKIFTVSKKKRFCIWMASHRESHRKRFQQMCFTLFQGSF